MKRMFALVALVVGLAACDNSGQAKAKADSLKDKLDTTLQKIGDSAEAKGKRTVEAVKDKLNNLGNKADSATEDTAR